ncbi:hypothetical protein LZC95_09650 [Pendulispora brunnea]|uniref:Uncharacterized protein n=1 Tax=Pendulispora brunnea TaxID=2905690 RepID=A0ABZ2KEL7_9BACT
MREQRLRGRFSRASPNFWLFALVGVLVILLGYRFFAMRKLDSAKDVLLSKQRAVQVTVGVEWEKVRDQIEKFTVENATAWAGDWKDSNAGDWDFRSTPGVYLRLRVAEASDVTRLRKAAQDSLRDGFVACFLREPNAAGARGELDGGLFPDQPWNLRQAYASTRILTDDWVREVKDSGDDLRLRVFEQQFKQGIEHEIPQAVEIIKRAQFFLLVLDEDAAEAASFADGGTVTSDVLQMVPHDARVSILNLRSGNAIARFRRRASGTAVSAGEKPISDPDIANAVKRQVNNCSLAMAISSAIGFQRK